MNPDPTNPQRSIDTGLGADLAAAHGEWVPQADAARIAGCSISAVRNWRREGVIDDRRTTTTGGLERVEVRLADVLDRAGREPGRHVAPDSVADVGQAPAAHPGTVIIPLSDLQALILSLGEAERRAGEAPSQMFDPGTQKLTAVLARAEADLVAARSEVERHRRRVRELEAASAGGSHRAGAGLENERLREQVTKLETRMAESRSEVDGQRRRIRELEARQATPSQDAAAAKAENERLYKQMARLEARLAESGNEVVTLRRRLRELESTPVASRQYLAEPYDDERQLDRSSAPSSVQSGPDQAAMVSSVKAAMPGPGDRDVDVIGPPPATEAELEPTAERLRVLYQRLHGRPRRDTPNPDEQRQWIADLASYDEALVVACIELGVPTSFEPGHRLPAAVRVELTRALRGVGVDVAS